CTELKLSDY
nr:Chain M, Nucleoprotein [H7N9 subtype]4NQV_N Chain N, Nucleoprotein [H7N9 subtype]4NQV_O Chain O, Nucleoprotein [H7N9 subtype]4NQV_P Chain P, Nucleoprotein [H7N9 subtype]4NQV_Q Chain Q, Nucleoprotein [H7N9 subtype]4NQV_R Chain R, Nucleoprotein [H7N9 subtype]6J2A_C Chain C, NP44 [Influenza A virus]